MSSSKKQKIQQPQEEQKSNAEQDVNANFLGFNSFDPLQNALSFLPHSDLGRMQRISKIGHREFLKAFSLITKVDTSSWKTAIDRLYKLKWKVEYLRAVEKNCWKLDALTVAEIKIKGRWKNAPALLNERWELALKIIKNNKTISKFVGHSIPASWIDQVSSLQLPLSTLRELTCSFDPPALTAEQLKKVVQSSHGNQLRHLKFEGPSRYYDLSGVILDPVTVLENCPQLETLSFYPLNGIFGEHKATGNEENRKFLKLTSLEIKGDTLAIGQLVKMLKLTPNLTKFKCPLNNDFRMVSTFCPRITKLHLTTQGTTSAYHNQAGHFYEVLRNLPNLSELVVPRGTKFCDWMERLRESGQTLVALKRFSVREYLSAKDCENLGVVAPNIILLRIRGFQLYYSELQIGGVVLTKISPSALEVLSKTGLKLRILIVELMAKPNYEFLASKAVFPELRMLGGMDNYIESYEKSIGLTIDNCKHVGFYKYFTF